MKLEFEAQPEDGVILCHRTTDEGLKQSTIRYRKNSLKPLRANDVMTLGLNDEQWVEWCVACDIMGWRYQ